jgi:molecular chaperone GrpE
MQDQELEATEAVEGQDQEVASSAKSDLPPSSEQATEADGPDQQVKGATEKETGSDEEAGAPAVDEVAALQQALDEARAKEAEYLDGWQRARAELSNARKRFQREREQAYTNAKGDVLTQLLPIADDFERAIETLPENLSNLTWTEGVALIQRKLQQLLEQAGVTPIEAVGQEFDPFLHQAVTHEPSETVPAGQVIAEMQKGYQAGDRVLRPSVVRVSAGPPAEAEVEVETRDSETEVSENT